MRTWVRTTLAILVILVLLVVTIVATLLWVGERKRTRQVQLPPLAAPAFADDAAARQRGAYLYASRGCAECHGADGAGRVFVDDGSLRLKGGAIHSGPGSSTLHYKPADWDRLLRHGVKPDGTPAMIMPSEDYNRFTDADLAALVSHVRSLPPAGGGAAELVLPLPVRVLYGAGLIEDAAAKIDHRLPVQAPVAEGVTVEHGRYVANMCIGCHGPGLAGGRIPGGPPDWPPAARLSAGDRSAMLRYPDAEALIALFRSGKRADGSAVQVMPFGSLSKLSDTDLRALHLYLKTL
ncbi:MAG: c-type cytochrome [Ideonella sp.]|nr:c-type cytochrome [Ideonella sp.]MCC7457201.1 c-type cytochrome [Nitrospira sp.]